MTQAGPSPPAAKELMTMYLILKKEALNPTVTRMVIDAPLIAKKAEPGQFIILRVHEGGERIPPDHRRL